MFNLTPKTLTGTKKMKNRIYVCFVRWEENGKRYTTALWAFKKREQAADYTLMKQANTLPNDPQKNFYYYEDVPVLNSYFLGEPFNK